ncbi:SDR family NAD(P)-dependent oxidoreductase [Paenibacillus sp. TAB 01]|uniref:SDR family NAD(P)-dependent oxidoreductase n=1 Tax=Paenibacillus sp. TAB 01 TaxID=3368988 RepID=UPI00375218D6
MEVKGKAVLITGGGTGIGRSIALKFAQEGAHVAINYSKSRTEAEETVRLVEAYGVQGFVCQADVSDNNQVIGMYEAVKQQFGRIDILVNNAGTTHFVDLSDLNGLTELYWDQTYNVNVKGMFFTSRACADELVRNKGCIINITSIAGFNGMGSSIAYAASKAAGISLTKSFAKVLAPSVRVNSIAPGIVITRWVDGKEGHVDKYSSQTPLGRAALPEDVADVAWALARNADFVTGQTIVVDGGWSM